MLHTETVTAETLDLMKRLMADEKLKDFYLVGGTALALILGHRKSIDIDLFTNVDFDSQKLGEYLSQKFRVENPAFANNTFSAFIENTKSDFITHSYPLLK